MEDMIRMILEIDRKAREMTAEAEELKNKAHSELPAKKEELRAGFLRHAQERIEQTRIKALQIAEETRYQIRADYESEKRTLEERAAQNHDCWVDQLVRRVIEN